jgi:uncharacterized protein
MELEPSIDGQLAAVESYLRAHFPIQGYSLHGPGHWERVKLNGLYLAQKTGADPLVVRLFATFHDCQRVNESTDPGHGARGAQMALSLRSKLPIDDDQMDLLVEACDGHTDICFHDNVTIGTCWDSDRLDLDRVGIRPDPGRLNTEAAKLLASYEWDFRRRLVKPQR